MRISSLYAAFTIFFVIYLPRLPGGIPADIAAVGVFMGFYTVHLAVSTGPQKRVPLGNLWLFFVPFFLYCFIPVAIQGDPYWLIWSLHAVVVAFALPRLAVFMGSDGLKRTFFIFTALVIGSVLLEVFGPIEVREHLALLKISKNVKDVSDYLTRFAGRYTGIIADVPSSGAVMGMSLAILTNYFRSGGLVGKKKKDALLMLAFMSLSMFAMLFSSRVWLAMTVFYISVMLVIKGQLKVLVATAAVVTVAAVVLMQFEEVSAAFSLITVLLPLIMLETQDVRAISSVGKEYSAADNFLDLGTLSQLFGTGVAARYSEVETDIGFLRFLMGVGVFGTIILVSCYLAVLLYLFRKYRVDPWHGPATFATLALIAYNFKGSSLNGLYFFPMYVIVLIICALNMRDNTSRDRLFGAPGRKEALDVTSTR